MAAYWALTILVAAAVSNASGSRIVGGEVTSIENYPSIVQVEFRNGILWSQSCAASIITPTWVLSAAHCFEGILYSSSNRRIRAGSSNRNSGGVVINVRSRVNHPDYGWRNNNADLSCVRLTSSLTLGSPQTQSIPIISHGFVLPDNLPVVHAGWGTTASGGSSSALLRDVTIYTINNDLCRQRYLSRPIPATVTENMICAGILDVGGKDACQGDSGGPLYYGNILVGVVSWGAGCADAFFPGVSTRIASYTNWIVSTAN